VADSLAEAKAAEHGDRMRILGRTIPPVWICD
jgi:hypothetical protein